MVRLHTSLLALTFATGLVLASSDDYERRDDELFERDLNVEEFFGRQYDLLDERSDSFDEPQARSLFDGLFKIGEEVGDKAFSKFRKVAKTAAKIEHHAGSAKKIEKHVKPATRLEKKMKPSKRMTLNPQGRIVRQLITIRRAGKHAVKETNKNNNDNRNSGSQNRINQDLEHARKEVADADRYQPANHQYHVQSRSLEDDEELLQRDLDDEEVFEREYYGLLDERDTFDDLD